MYKYERPKGKKYKVSGFYHNKLITNKKKMNPVFFYYLYFVSDDVITFESRYTLLGKLLFTFLSIPCILIYGFPEVYSEFKNVWNAEKYGSFVSDAIIKKISEEEYNKVKSKLQKEDKHVE